jgi:hypothetical protein
MSTGYSPAMPEFNTTAAASASTEEQKQEEVYDQELPPPLLPSNGLDSRSLNTVDSMEDIVLEYSQLEKAPPALYRTRSTEPYSFQTHGSEFSQQQPPSLYEEEAALPTLEAVKVEDDDNIGSSHFTNIVAAVAEKDTCWAFYKRN